MATLNSYVKLPEGKWDGKYMGQLLDIIYYLDYIVVSEMWWNLTQPNGGVLNIPPNHPTLDYFNYWNVWFWSNILGHPQMALI